MMNTFSFTATYPGGTEDLMIEELKSAGAEDIHIHSYRVHFSGTLETAYKACLHSRIANRILMELLTVPAGNPDSFYTELYEYPWEGIIDHTATIGIRAKGTNPAFRHTGFTARKAKDAIVDRLRERCGSRPDIDSERPGTALYIQLSHREARIYLDFSGIPLFKRGYRTEGGTAPIKENTAAAMLMRARWPGQFPTMTLFDPMCGSGTLLIEGALIALGIPPGIFRTYFGFFGWKGHDPGIWNTVKAEAEERGSINRNGLVNKLKIVGCDISHAQLSIARENVKSAHLEDCISLQQGDFFSEPLLSQKTETGLIVLNPPYGKRIAGETDDSREIESFYTAIGDSLKAYYPGWKASLITSPPETGYHVGIKASRTNALSNGGLDCRVFHMEIFSQNQRDELRSKKETRSPEDLEEHPRMLYNRLKKNMRNLKKWLKKEGVTSFRIYDKDIPEYGTAIDLYENSWLFVQEYAPPKTVDKGKAALHLKEILDVLPLCFDIPTEQIYVRSRERKRGRDQYTKQGDSADRFIMKEGGLRFYVNFNNYLDTGIFLDHRLVRKRIGETEAAGRKRFLNLFCYTGTASVYAANAGWKTTSVDASPTYINWAIDNFTLNGIDPSSHTFITEGCFEWLAASRDMFELILLDPPTFSNTKSRRRSFDIQNDYIELINLSLKRLVFGGTLLFSTNFRKFKPDFDSLADVTIREITAETIPMDFRRTIHRCYEISKNKKQTKIDTM